MKLFESWRLKPFTRMDPENYPHTPREEVERLNDELAIIYEIYRVFRTYKLMAYGIALAGIIIIIALIII